MIAIHKHYQGFHKGWIAHCEAIGQPYKLVDCYGSDIIKQLEGCDILFWHHSHANPKDILFAKQLLFALQHVGIKVFPDFRTGWYFDDKIGQKYLLESLNAPMVESFVFYTPESAMNWIDIQHFPKVFKLRGGAGSSNVRLVKTKANAKALVKRAFGRGFASFNPWSNLKDTLIAMRQKKKGLLDFSKAIYRLFVYPKYAKVAGMERGYIYFQEYIPDNQFDVRIIVIGDKAFGLKRFVRDGDFRASGSGNFAYAREEFDIRCIQIAFNLNKHICSQCIAYDFVFNTKNEPLIVEISYGYTPSGYTFCPGFWDENLVWHEGFVNSEAWMIDLMLKSKVVEL